jgi:hypothetical protein
MALLMRRAPAQFRAIVLHEMAHIAHGDVGRTYFTQALTISVLALGIAPLAVYALGEATLGFGRRVVSTVTGQPAEWALLFTDVLPSVALIVVPAILSLLLVLALRASILRVREVYADWQAAVWGGEEGLTTILAEARKHESPSRRPQWLHLHPTAGERLALLNHPDRLFRVTLDIPVYAGLLSGITITGMIPLLIQLLSASVAGSTALTAALGSIGVATDSRAVAWLAIIFAAMTLLITVLVLILPFLIITVQIAGSLGLQVAREAVADLAAPQHRDLRGFLGLLPSAVLFSVGMQVGFLIVPYSFLMPLGGMLYANLRFGVWLRAAAETIGWVTVMTGLMWLALAFLRVLARRILGEHTGLHNPRGKRRAITLITTLLLWIILLVGIGWQFNIYRTIWPQIPFRALAGATVVTLAVGGLIAAIGAGWIAARVLLIRPRCPVCQTPTQARIVVGRSCNHCGSDLAPWLFVS